MLDIVPSAEEMTALVGQSLYDVWNKLCLLIDEKYEMDCQWNKGGKAWTYEYKYRRGGKTLCALYARENCIGFMIIFGKDERSKFEAERNHYSKQVQKVYDEAQIYHDGKWVMFELTDTSMFCDLIKLLGIKRKPNRSKEKLSKAEQIMNERFGRDTLIALATVDGNIPNVRTVNAYYENGAFYIITHAQSNKIKQIAENPNVGICGEWFTAHGKGTNIGWFCKEDNKVIARKLREVFCKWIDNGHTDFSDKNTIILRVELTDGLLLSHGTRYAF